MEDKGEHGILGQDMTAKCGEICVASVTDSAAALEGAILSLCKRLAGEGTGATARDLAETAHGILWSCARGDAMGRYGGVDAAANEKSYFEALGACVELRARLGALAETRPMRAMRGGTDGCLKLVPCVSKTAIEGAIDQVETVVSSWRMR